MMFVAVTAEESGTLGSEYFAANPPVPVAQMYGGLNMDNLYAIGQTRDLTVIGFGASELDEYLRRAAAKQGRVLVPEPTPEKGFYYRSDHFNLAKQGVPMLYTKAGIDSPTKGAEYGRAWLEDYVANRYHKPSDEYDASWDVSGMLQDIAVYYDVGLALANESDVAELARWQRIPRDPRQEPRGGGALKDARTTGKAQHARPYRHRHDQHAGHSGSRGRVPALPRLPRRGRWRPRPGHRSRLGPAGAGERAGRDARTGERRPTPTCGSSKAPPTSITSRSPASAGTRSN